VQDPDQRVVICRAADTASRAAMDAIACEAERPRPRFCNQPGSGG